MWQSWKKYLSLSSSGDEWCMSRCSGTERRRLGDDPSPGEGIVLTPWISPDKRGSEFRKGHTQERGQSMVCVTAKYSPRIFWSACLLTEFLPHWNPNSCEFLGGFSAWQTNAPSVLTQAWLLMGSDGMGGGGRHNSRKCWYRIKKYTWHAPEASPHLSWGSQIWQVTQPPPRKQKDPCLLMSPAQRGPAAMCTLVAGRSRSDSSPNLSCLAPLLFVVILQTGMKYTSWFRAGGKKRKIFRKWKL